MTAPVLDINNVPIWINILIYMSMYQWYLLAAILPTVYIVIVKMIGFPLLQRWSNEVVIMLYPNKVKFSKVTTQYEPYFQYKKGIYWRADPLTPLPLNKPVEIKQKKVSKKKLKKDELLELESTEQQVPTEPEMKTFLMPPNNIHIFTHAINQEVFSMNRRDAKVGEILNGEHKIKPIAGHGIWIMQNFTLHFHRHWLMTIDPMGQFYWLEPVKAKQQFAVSFFHTLGIVYQKPIESKGKEMEVTSGEGGGKIMQIAVTNQYIVSQLKHVQEYPNFSAGRAYKLAQRMNRLEHNFYYWISGTFDMRVIAVMGGAIGAVVMVIFMMHGNGPPAGLGPMPGGH